MTVYIACGLTAVPREVFSEYTNFIHQLATALRRGCCDSVRYALVDSDPQLAYKPEHERARLCYLWDRELIEQADVIVADATFPSIGVGIELQIAEARDIPVVLSFHKSAAYRLAPAEYENPDHSHHSLQIGEGFVSIMALGLPAIFRTIAYLNHDDGIREIVKTVSLLERK